jgi:hypothetical protein
MSKTLLGVVASLVLAGGAVALKSGEAVDADAVLIAADGSKSVVTVRCRSGAKEGELDCGDLPEGATVVAETASKPYLSLASAGEKVERESPCACGPVKPSDCMVDTGDGTRAARAGEHLFPGTWSGGCVPKACYEHSAINALGSALPVACGGKNYGAKVDAPAPAEKVIADPAVEAGEVVKP